MLAALLAVGGLNSATALADRYDPKAPPNPTHGDDPHGDDPHGRNPHLPPAHDPDLPANAHDRDPYDGQQGNDKKHPNKPIPDPDN
jgi:hypothetical protein